ncbi:MAG: Thymidylate kinase [candidate division CPR2 bacterium GW2011_GWC1_39_9]|uniref:Thymidylate kinase n=1 Tax=candidate division CPR2 bacterium GW2011_GWC2_39_10 TaxID=1618345 RepID=A0A0G0LV16_UNCC2|nr:MAG: Thymidylate kinase [candidate division CPR2 bacterium GW2011_GWC2_39_10]KKR33918.1 MAG: Thymidylate kinase [candidate division CPR2 bacterium GW2011_GWC1_39_9]
MELVFPGRFIVLEGNEGSGKGTQIEVLKKRLETLYPGKEIISTTEPWDDPASPEGQRIKRILQEKEKEINPGEKFDAVKFQTLYIADRYIHWAKLIIPALKRGAIILSDRERLSTYAFTLAYGGSLDEAVSWHRLLPVPDMTLYLRVTPEVSVKRIGLRKDKQIEIFDKTESVRKVFNAYEEVIASRVIPNIEVVNGEESEEVVSESIMRVVNDCFGLDLSLSPEAVFEVD